MGALTLKQLAKLAAKKSPAEIKAAAKQLEMIAEVKATGGQGVAKVAATKATATKIIATKAAGAKTAGMAAGKAAAATKVFGISLGGLGPLALLVAAGAVSYFLYNYYIKSVETSEASS
ncbi:MAG: hypothetical protein QF511_02310 [Rhodospirillales bacterium]|jgi:hypothetical protein|nr:hypothetical protein [Rhodospirillales bacterium]MDP7215508.1 hypothetical protein [Rhodospirillales bacterium]HIJ43195.1 hypothetical protein [Rhodospirillaceae bacterium]HIJ45744.1 hypothetical protein [Rhodospirillaceae bacterium]HIJ92910.1 hypothetical protein [Rhodospirillaceae bacterium]